MLLIKLLLLPFFVAYSMTNARVNLKLKLKVKGAELLDSGGRYGGDVDFQKNGPENQNMWSPLEAAVGNIDKLSDEDPWKMNAVAQQAANAGSRCSRCDCCCFWPPPDACRCDCCTIL